MLNRFTFPIALGILVAVFQPAAVSAGVIAFHTPAGATDSAGPVDAMVTFTTSAGQVTILLQDLLSDPTSVGQLVSGLDFTISTGQTSGSLASSSGLLRTVAGDGTFSDGGLVDTRWAFDVAGNQMELSALGNGQPKQTIIGPPAGSGLYDSANGSIGGNGPHNPFLAQSATFVLNVPGVTDQSGIQSVIFGFGTQGDQSVADNTIIPTPEPATLAVLALGSLGLFARRRRA